jgi:hypothetical protein
MPFCQGIGINQINMNDMENDDNAVGCFCTLIDEWKGYYEGEIIEDYGMQYVVRLTSGCELTVNRDDVVVCF